MIELCKRACKGCTSDGTLCRQFAYLLDKWIPTSTQLPKKDGEYLVSMEAEFGYETHSYIDLAYFTKDLYGIDDHDFCHKKGIAGFYKCSSEWGPYEVEPIAWQPLPEPYKEVTK